MSYEQGYLTQQREYSQYFTITINEMVVVILVANSCDPMDCSLPGSSVHGDSLGKNTGVGCQFLLQGIFLTQEMNPGLLRCKHSLPTEL